jgi:hypothetical protein
MIQQMFIDGMAAVHHAGLNQLANQVPNQLASIRLANSLQGPSLKMKNEKSCPGN